MATCTYGFELGANGATVAITDPGDSDQWETVSIVAGGTCVYDTAQKAVGTKSCKIATGATAGGVNLRWQTKLGTLIDHYGRAYFYFTVNPGVALVIVDARTSTTRGAGIELVSTGKIATMDSVGVVSTSTNSFPLNQWFRVEWHFFHDVSVGSVEAKLFFTDPNAVTPTETLTLGSRNTLANVDRMLFGMNSTQANIANFWMDSIVAGAAAYPGPAGVVPTRTLLRVGA